MQPPNDFFKTFWLIKSQKRSVIFLELSFRFDFCQIWSRIRHVLYFQQRMNFLLVFKKIHPKQISYRVQNRILPVHFWICPIKIARKTTQLLREKKTMQLLILNTLPHMSPNAIRCKLDVRITHFTNKFSTVRHNNWSNNWRNSRLVNKSRILKTTCYRL